MKHHDQTFTIAWILTFMGINMALLSNYSLALFNLSLGIVLFFYGWSEEKDEKSRRKGK